MSADQIINTSTATTEERAQASSAFTSNADIEFEAFCKKYFGNSEPGFVKKSSKRLHANPTKPKTHVKDLFEVKNESNSNQDRKINGDYNEFYNVSYISNGENFVKKQDDNKQQSISKPSQGIDFSNLSINNNNNKEKYYTFAANEKLTNTTIIDKNCLNSNTNVDNLKPYIISETDRNIKNYWDSIYGYSNNDSKTTSESNANTIVDTKNYKYENVLMNSKNSDIEEKNLNENFKVSKEEINNSLHEHKQPSLNTFKIEDSIKTQVKLVEIAASEEITKTQEKNVEKGELDDISRRPFAFKSEFRNKTLKAPIGSPIPIAAPSTLQGTSLETTKKIKSSLKVRKKLSLEICFQLIYTNI